MRDTFTMATIENTHQINSILIVIMLQTIMGMDMTKADNLSSYSNVVVATSEDTKCVAALRN